MLLSMSHLIRHTPFCAWWNLFTGFEFSTQHGWCTYFSGFISEFIHALFFSMVGDVSIDNKASVVISSVSRIYQLCFSKGYVRVFVEMSVRACL